MNVLFTEYKPGEEDVKTTIEVSEFTEEVLKKALIKNIFDADDDYDGCQIHLFKDKDSDNIYHLGSVRVKCTILGHHTKWIPIGIYGKIELI